MMRKHIFLLLALCLHIAARGQTIPNDLDLSWLPQPTQAKALRYWIDDDMGSMQTTNILNGQHLVDVSSLLDGLHTIHFQIIDSEDKVATPYSSIFLKIGTMAEAEEVTVNKLVYWFDDEETTTTTDMLSGIMTLDASGLLDGLHTIHYMVVCSDGSITSAYSSIFLKMNIEIQSTTAQSLRYWFDDESDVKTTSVSGGTQSIDVSNLLSGLHTLHYQLVDNSGQVTSPVSGVFIKNFDMVLADGGNRITKYQYWQNTNSTAMQTVELASADNPYKLIALLPMQKEPIRSSSFHFEVTDGVPMVYAKNELHVRFHDAIGYFVDDSRDFIDYSVKQEVKDIEWLESGIRSTTEKPAANIIKWYCVEAERGDSLQFKLDRAATVQLFAPSGKEVLSVSGSESVKWSGLHAAESGTFYVALHDVTATQGNTISIDYNHIDKYAVLEIDIDEIGLAPSIVPMTIHGNGFDRLRRVCLSLEGDTIQSDCQDVLDKATTIAMFTLLGGEKLGAYDLTLEFDDEEEGTVSLRIPKRIHLAKPVWGEVVVDVTTARTLATPYPVHIKVRNTGNVARLYTPLTIAFDHSEVVNSVNFENFFVAMGQTAQSEDYNPVVQTDNFAGRGTRAEAAYLFIQTLAPGETKDLTMSLNAPSHAKLNVYAQPGKSANDKESLPDKTQGSEGQGSEGQEGSGGTAEPEGGGHGADTRDCTTTPSLWEYLAEHTDFEPSDDLLDNLGDLDLPGLAGRMVERMQQARDIVNNAVGIGRVIANIVNGVRLNHYMAVADAAGVDDEMRETLRNSVQLELPSDILNDAGHPIMGGLSAYWEWQQMRSECSDTPPTPHPVEILNAGDPNDIFGYTSESGSKYMKEGTTGVYYTIEFENDPKIATAAAHTIVVRDTLDTQRFDLSTFAATSIKLGNKDAVQLGGVKSIDRMTIDLRPENYVIAQVSLSLDERKGIATWTIESLDPMTMEPTEDAMQGVLPVNSNGNGQGELSFDISLKPGMAEGDLVSNRAAIVFDREGVIMTPTWTNTVDATLPESRIADVAMATDSTVCVRIAATDELSKPWRYDLYIQEDTDGAWKHGAANVPVDSIAQIAVKEGVSYGFYVVVTDSAGNVEQKAAAREFTFEVFGSQVDTNTQIELAQGWNWISHNQQEPLSVEALKPASARMLGQTEETINDSRFGWMGDLEELLPTQMYKIQTDEVKTVQLSGRLFNAGFRAVPLYEGWNWLGYPVANTMTPAEALSKLDAEDGDFLIGQDGMATYSEGQWTGTLTEMVPGLGYMYRSGSDKNLFYNATAQASSRRVQSSQSTVHSSEMPEGWTVNKRKYPNVMGVIAQLWHEDNMANSDEWLLGAFCGDECRGIAKVVDGTLMMNVYGQGGEMIVFRAMNYETGEVLYAAEQETFRADVVGTMNSPYQMHIGDATGIAGNNAGSISDSRYYDLQGRAVNDINAQKGLYIVTDSQRSKTQKVVKK